MLEVSCMTAFHFNYLYLEKPVEINSARDGRQVEMTAASPI